MAAGAELGAGVGVGEDVAQREARVGDEVGSPAGAVAVGGEAVAPLVDEVHAGLVADLVVPAEGAVHVDDVVETVLEFLAEGGGADDAEVEFEDVEPGGAARAVGGADDVQGDAAVEPGGVGAVVGLVGGGPGIDGGVDVLADGEADAVGAAGGHEFAEGFGEKSGGGEDVLAPEVGEVAGEEGDLEAVGVGLVGAGEVFVVLGVEGERARVRGVFDHRGGGGGGRRLGGGEGGRDVDKQDGQTGEEEARVHGGGGSTGMEPRLHGQKT